MEDNRHGLNTTPISELFAALRFIQPGCSISGLPVGAETLQILVGKAARQAAADISGVRLWKKAEIERIRHDLVTVVLWMKVIAAIRLRRENRGAIELACGFIEVASNGPAHVSESMAQALNSIPEGECPRCGKIKT